MSWQTLDRNKPIFDPKAPPLLSEAVREKIRSFFPRYETRRAVLLPALHVVQDALGHVPPKAMVEIAELLEIHPSDVLDTISFYTHFWTHPKGKKVITVCRSISCEVMGSGAVLQEIKKLLGIEEHDTTPDGKYSLVTEECLAGCDHAPCLLINEKLHKKVKVEDVSALLADEKNVEIGVPRSDLFDAPAAGALAASASSDRGPADGAEDGSGVGASAEMMESMIETTSDVKEMREA
jgi:NADH-quinone oxidoreductase subunit E